MSGVCRSLVAMPSFVSLNKELRQDVFIPEDKTMGATGHDKVVVRITDWDRKSKNPRGGSRRYPR